MTPSVKLGTMLVGGLLPLLCSPAAAQTVSESAANEKPAPDVDEIIVVAQKRAESSQRVPITISAFSGAQLAQNNITQVADLPRIVPTLRFGSGPGSVAARLSVRGIGSFGNSAIEPSVAVFLDNIYVPRPASVLGTFLDLQAVEVLSGPQGTLFGRNASVGAVTLRSAEPQQEFSGRISMEGGTGNRYRGEAVINLPLSDTVAIRAAGQISKFGGFWFNGPDRDRFGKNDYYTGRLSLKMNLTDRLTWLVRADYTDNESETITNWALVPNTLRPSTIARLTALQRGVAPDLIPFDRRTNYSIDGNDIDGYHWGVSSDLGLEFGNGFTARLISGYRDWKTSEFDRAVTLLTPYYRRNVRWRSRSHSEDLQIISPTDQLLDGKLAFVGGLYYFREKLGTDYDFDFTRNFCTDIGGAVSSALAASCLSAPLSQALLTPFRQTTTSYAAYGQASYDLVPTVKLTLGGRFTRDEKDGFFGTTVNNPAAALIGANEQTFLTTDGNRFTWRANLAWTPVRDVMLFATYSTGFKSGGFNNGSSRVPLGQLRIFAPETVKNYEVGLKSQWLDRALTVNMTAYRMEISDFQERGLDGVTTVVRNVGDIRNQGFEAEAVARPIRGIRLNANVAYLDSQFTRYPNAPNPPYLPGTQDLSGVRPTYAPKWSGVVGAQAEGDLGKSGLSFALRGDVSFVGRQNVGASIDNSILTVQKGYAQLGTRLSVYGPQQRWSIFVAGENLTDKGFCENMFYQVLEGALGLRYGDADSSRGTAVRCVVGSPRRFTLGASFNF